MSIARTYAEYATSTEYSDLPREVIGYAKILIQDYIGLAVGGLHYSPSAPVLVDGIDTLAKYETGHQGATVLATGHRYSPAYAGMLNGALAHSLDFDDTVVGGHVGAPVISAALAAGETANVNGETFLAGVVTGYEVMTRLLLAINRSVHYNRGFHPTATCGVFGATAAAGVMLGVETDVLRNAFGINASQISGTNGYSIHGGWNKRLHPGLCAHSALIALTFAAAGFEGISNPIKGEKNFFAAYTDDAMPDRAIESLEKEYNILRTGLKPYPCGRRNHSSMDLASSLVGNYGIRPDEIEAVNIEVSSQNVRDLATPPSDKRHPTNLVEAQFSLYFCVALAITRRNPGIQTFIGEISEGYDPIIQTVMDRIMVTSNDEIFPDGNHDHHAKVEIECRDDTFSASAIYPSGDPQNPLTTDQVNEKFTQLTPNLSSARRNSITGAIQSIENIDLVDFTRLFSSERKT